MSPEPEQPAPLDAELLRALVESSAAITFVYQGTRNVYANPAAERATGYSRQELLELDFWDIIHPDDRARVRARGEARQRGEDVPPNYEVRIVTKSGQVRWLDFTGVVVVLDGQPAVLGTAFDISERRRLEQEALRAQRLESLGLLAGGLAHDFNNFLCAVKANLSLALYRSPEGDPRRDSLQEAQQACRRAQELTQQLLTFARGGAPVTRPVALPALLRQVVGFGLRGSQVTCSLELAGDLPPVEADEGQLAQVVHNLVLNAVQAMPDGGTLRVGAEPLEAPPGLPPGAYLRLWVEDEGPGIPPQHHARVFDPYFTTKQGGSGLGLAGAHSIVARHGGALRLETAAPAGARFVIDLPVAASSGEPSQGPATEPGSPGGSGKVLVMDDEEAVARACQAILDELGYETHLVQDGADALEAYEQARQTGEPYDLVLLDVTVPGGMGGLEAMRRLRTLDPAVRALVASGYSNSPVLSRYADYGFLGCLQKPFGLEELSRQVREALARDD